MTILIAESGATKTSWLLANSKAGIIAEFETMGFSPVHHLLPDIVAGIKANSGLMQTNNQFKDLYFFGAGCSSPERCFKIETALRQVFPDARQIIVEHDILAAAYATCGKNAGISCILGTGSNACYYDGTTLYEGNPSLDFILGGEGSGTQIGIRMLKGYLYKQLPDELMNDFKKKYPHINKEAVLAEVYANKHPKKFLSGFALFAFEHAQNSWVKQQIEHCFNEFIQNQLIQPFGHLLFTPPAKSPVTVHFVGSIAHHFAQILRNCLATRNINHVGKIIQSPAHHLAHYLLEEKTASNKRNSGKY